MKNIFCLALAVWPVLTALTAQTVTEAEARQAAIAFFQQHDRPEVRTVTQLVVAPRTGERTAHKSTG